MSTVTRPFKTSADARKSLNDLLTRFSVEIVGAAVEVARTELAEGILGGAPTRGSEVDRRLSLLAGGPKVVDGSKQKGAPYSKRPMTAADKKRTELHGRYVGMISHAATAKDKEEARRIFQSKGPEAAVKYLTKIKLNRAHGKHAAPVKAAVKKAPVKKASKPAAKKAPAKKKASKPAAAKTTTAPAKAA